MSREAPALGTGLSEAGSRARRMGSWKSQSRRDSERAMMSASVTPHSSQNAGAKDEKIVDLDETAR